MATNVTQTTFLSQYNDDYRDSDHYHRILFNNGRHLQARELTQMQTIIQEEMARIAGYLFKEGGIFNTSYGALNSGFYGIDYIKVTSLPVGYATLKGTDITNAAGVKATVKDVLPADGADAATLYLIYKTSNNLTATNTTSPKIFAPGELLTYDTGAISGTISVQTTNTSTNPAFGKGAYVEVPTFTTFVAGHLVVCEAQSLVVSKYNKAPTAVVGFKLTEQVVSATDDIALYDNSGSTPNLTSPGADRYKISLTLTKESDITSGETFYPLIEIKNGVSTAVQSRDNLLNELGTLVHSRTSNINGDFVLRNSQFGQFDLEIHDDSDDDYLQYKIDGGVAYVGGRRIEKNKSQTLRVEKSRSASADILSVSPTFATAEYGNYLLADSAYGLLTRVTNLETINLYSAADRGGSVIGTARLRNVDEFGDQFRFHIFDVKMDSSGGTPYGISQVASIGDDATNYANTVEIKGRVDIQDKLANDLLFPLKESRTQELQTVSLAVRKIYTDTTDGSGVATFSTGSSNIFTNQEDWIVQVNSTGVLYSPPTVSGTPTTSATVTGLPNSTAVSMLGYETISATLKTKTLNTNQSSGSISLTSRRFKLDKADIYKFNSVIDDATGQDITYKFIFDNGQRDNFYTVGGGKLKSGAAAPSGTITVNFDYFSHSAGDYFGGRISYPDIEFKNIPFYTKANGQRVRLSDVIDMRPVKNTTGSSFTGTGAVRTVLPKNTGLITIGTAKHWEPRIDIISMSPNGDYVINKGATRHNPQDPSVSPADLHLHRISLQPYTMNSRDVFYEKAFNSGYTMKDIERLDARLNNLENVTSLTLAELETNKITVPDPNNSTLPDRVKLGITADGFAGNLQSDVLDPDYRATLNPYQNLMTTLNYQRQTGLSYDSDQSTSTILKGSTIWPKYTEEVMIDQGVASRAINVNQFEISKSIGSVTMTPNVDTWQVRKKVDASYQVASSTSYLPTGSTSVSSQGSNGTA